MSEQQESPTRDTDKSTRLLPLANLSRVMKRALPPASKISKDSKEVIEDSAVEFLLFLTSQFSETVHAEDRKAVSGEDVLNALSELGFDNYFDLARVYLNRFKESQGKLVVGKNSANHDQQQQILQQEQHREGY